MDKIKEFFQQTWVVVTGWSLALLGALVLIIGGTTPATITEGVGLVAGVLSAVGLLIAFISSKIAKK